MLEFALRLGIGRGKSPENLFDILCVWLAWRSLASLGLAAPGPGRARLGGHSKFSSLFATWDNPTFGPGRRRGLSAQIENISTVTATKLVANLKLTPTREHGALFRAMLARCNACNFLAAVAWQTGKIRRFDLHMLADHARRGMFDVTAQAAVRCIRRGGLYNWSFGRFRWSVASKARLSGVPVCYVDPSHISKGCLCCGCIDDRDRRKQATFSSVSCRHSEPADLNAARDIRVRATASAD
jgi:hypothetical protein